MDHQNRVGGKTGTGGNLSYTEANAERRERLRKLALETIDLSKDPYFMKNHLGTYECRLCLTIHTNEGSYLGHTQGKKHQASLAKRAHKEAEAAARLAGTTLSPVESNLTKKIKRTFTKIGRPAYKIIKQRNTTSGEEGLLFQLHFPSLQVEPSYRIMSAFEQGRDLPPNKDYQYLVVASEPYESVAFKIPNLKIENQPIPTLFDPDTNIFIIQIVFSSSSL